METRLGPLLVIIGQDVKDLHPAAKAFPVWAATPPTKRAAMMHEAARKMREVVDEVAKLLSQEQGKPFAHAKIEAMRVAENLEYFAGLADKIRGDYIPLDDPSKSRWHDKERVLLAAMEAELARQRGGGSSTSKGGSGAREGSEEPPADYDGAAFPADDIPF